MGESTELTKGEAYDMGKMIGNSLRKREIWTGNYSLFFILAIEI
jgi:hypothetical protein